jgi:hypothetical protein
LFPQYFLPVSEVFAAMTNLRKAAEGRECQIRLPGICNFNPDTSVLAHLNGAGLAMKADDRHASITCSSCHDVVDHRVKTEFSREYIELAHHQGVIRTQKIWISEGFM